MKNVSNSKSETRVDVVGLVTKIRLIFGSRLLREVTSEGDWNKGCCLTGCEGVKHK